MMQTMLMRRSRSTISPLSIGILQRKCKSCGQHKLGSGHCVKCSTEQLSDSTLPPSQAKLRISQPNDKYEQEADRVAEQVMRMRQIQDLNPIGVSKHPVNLQQYRDQGFIGHLNRQVIEEEEESFSVTNLLSFKKKSESTPELSLGLTQEIQSLRGKGQSLDPSLRTFFEPRFGYDFRHVRVHTNPNAATTAKALNARAYTLQNDIVFASGEYQPKTLQGRKLLAHELTHVIQQGNHVQTIMRTCDCPAAGARNPTAAEDSFLRSTFPRLTSGNYCISAPSTPAYNCIAWSVGDTSQWIWNQVDSTYGDNDGTVSISDFDAFYGTRGLTPSGGSSNSEVALFSNGSTPTHAARVSTHPCGDFPYESKLGQSVRIMHDVFELEGGSVYGDITKFYDRNP